MSRKGSLSRKTYFPQTGDVLMNVEEGISWECVRSNAHLDPASGKKTRYGLLLGRSAEFEAPLRRTLHDSDDGSWLDDISQIHRDGKVYQHNSDTGTWQE